MYARFAEVYDTLMDDFDYPSWARYYIALIEREGVSPQTICDCACGTGSLAIEFARMGHRVTGVDLSEEMLHRAAEKARKSGVMIPFVRQDMRSLTLHKPVDAIVCGCDGVNYLLNEAQLRAFFLHAYRQLKIHGVLAFDFSSRYKLEEKMQNAFFGEERDDVAYLWQNRLEEEKHLLHMDITFFIKRSNGFYERFEERQTQRAHTIEELEPLLMECGFSAVRAYGDRTHASPSPNELRVHVTAVKR